MSGLFCFLAWVWVIPATSAFWENSQLNTASGRHDAHFCVPLPEKACPPQTQIFFNKTCHCPLASNIPSWKAPQTPTAPHLFPRSCTDVICCVLFLVFILGYIVVGIVGELTAAQGWSHGGRREEGHTRSTYFPNPQAPALPYSE